MWLLPGLPERRVGLYLRMHHAMADGIAGVAVIGALLDPAADAPVRTAPPWTPTAMPSARDLLGDNLRWRIQGLHGLLPRLAHPVSTLRQAQSAWPAWRELWAEERAPRISLNSPVGGHRSLALIRSRLPPADSTLPSGSRTPTMPRSTTSFSLPSAVDFESWSPTVENQSTR